jgi:hypothetical protein
MAKIGQADKGYDALASSSGALAAARRNEPWWHAWRWPAALVAGVALWLTLVAIAGATLPVVDGAVAPQSQISVSAGGS